MHCYYTLLSPHASALIPSSQPLNEHQDEKTPSSYRDEKGETRGATLVKRPASENKKSAVIADKEEASFTWRGTEAQWLRYPSP